ncbi:Splicing factor 3B subunit 4-like protein [Drosera capensis]
MAGNPNCTVYIGNLDERVTDRVLYDILIQAGRVVDLHMPRDRETNKLKGFAFAEYETDEIADYAVRLFSGLVILYNKTLKFQISGKDKPSPNMAAVSNSSHMYAPHGSISSDLPTYPNRPLSSSRFSPYSSNSGQGREPNGNISRLEGHYFDYAHGVFGASFDRVTSSGSTRSDSSNPISFPSI